MAKSSAAVSAPASSRDEPPPFSKPEIIHYIKDMLDSMEVLAVRQDEMLLAQVLKMAATEAENILRREE